MNLETYFVSKKSIEVGHKRALDYLADQLLNESPKCGDMVKTKDSYPDNPFSGRLTRKTIFEEAKIIGCEVSVSNEFKVITHLCTVEDIEEVI